MRGIKMGICLGLVLGLVLVLGGGTTFAAKPRLAVIEFANATAHSDWAIGGGITDMIITALVKSGKVDVIERSALDKVMAEQGLSASGLANPNTAVQAGKLLNVNYIVMGKVTEYGWSEKEMGFGGFGIKETTTRVALDARMIDTSTGKIALADSADASETQTGVSVADWQNLEIGMSGFDDTVIGKTTRAAVGNLIGKITGGITISGKIVQIKGNTVKINLAKGQVEKGNILVVYRKGEEIKDEETGEILDIEYDPVAEIEVTAVKDKLSDAKVLSVIKGMKIQKDNVVKPKVAEAAK